jgi:hypothetical protein
MKFGQSMILKREIILTPVILSLLIGGCTSAPQQEVSPSPSASPEQTVSPTTPSDKQQSLLIDNLEENKSKNKLGGAWVTYNDKEIGGDSQVSPTGEFKPSEGGADNSKYAAHLTGKVTKTAAYGFIGMATNLNSSGKAINLNQYKGISFCAKGDGKPYVFKLRSLAIKDYNDYSYQFVAQPEWQCYQLSFDEFKQSSLGTKTVSVPLNEALTQVNSIHWQTVGQPHESVNLFVDNIQFIK